MKNTAFSPPPPPTSLYPTPHHHLLLHLFLKPYNPHPLRLLRRRRRRHSQPPLSAASDKASELHRWDSTTARFAAASNVPFLLIQLPQILLNARNLLSGNHAALLAVPWLGMLTGLLGNLTLLSYFAKKKESEAVVVQTLGVVSIFVVLAQLAAAGAMVRPVFSAILAVVSLGLVLNFMNYFGRLDSGLWLLWEDFITVSGLSVLPQVMWSTFVPSIPNSALPGIISCTVAVAIIAMARMGKLPEDWVKFVRSISGWTATLLFMWMPIAQMWTTYLNPDNIKGLSALTILLGMIGNALMIPRALFIRDLMWFTGASWASILHGWGNLACMYFFNSISSAFFIPATLSLFLWIGIPLYISFLFASVSAYSYVSQLLGLQIECYDPCYSLWISKHLSQLRITVNFAEDNRRCRKKHLLWLWLFSELSFVLLLRRYEGFCLSTRSCSLERYGSLRIQHAIEILKRTSFRTMTIKKKCSWQTIHSDSTVHPP